MIRSLTRNMTCILAAVLLLALMVCALEVSLRSWRLQSRLHSGRRIRPLEELITPHETSWIDVRPLIDLKREFKQGPSIHIQTNEHGIRGPSITLPKPRGVYRILCVGGDNVFGASLNVKETVPDRLQRILNQQAGMPVEVLNAGCPRAGPLINLLRYRSHLSVLQPDLVIFCLSEEDLGFDREVRGALHLDQTRNPAYASHPGLRGQGSAFMDRLCEEFITVDWLLSWAGDVVGVRPQSATANIAPVRGSIQRDLAAMVPLSSLVSGNFGHLLISVSPSAWGVDRARNSIDKSQSSFAQDIRKFLQKVRLSQQVDVHDGLTAFLTSPDAHLAFSLETGALTAAGNDLYAQQLAEYLLQTIPGLRGTAASGATGVSEVPVNSPSVQTISGERIRERLERPRPLPGWNPPDRSPAILTR